ncbi:MAG TPA: hypothetical protein PKK48_05785 [Phycisphaerae bacterium]|nr:hypothetical protein [Phycisphaerae bacterium]HPS52188.1 hypothetical protein [Phycisphaerae bacterium]
MIKKEPTLEQLRKAIRQLDDELAGKADPLLSFVPREAFITYREYLREMLDIIETDKLPAILPKQYDEMSADIIANWPFTFLGMGIVEAQRAFGDYYNQEAARR